MPVEGGSLLAEFAGNGNTGGIRCLIELGVAAGCAAITEGDPFFDDRPGQYCAACGRLARRHSAGEGIDRTRRARERSRWKGRTALALAVKACVDSYWKACRSPESIAALLAAGASAAGIRLPMGYPEADELLHPHAGG